MSSLPYCQLYLVSPLAVGGQYPDQLRAALESGSVAAFQFRVKDIGEHEAARMAEPLRRICADAETAFIVNDSISLAKRLGADGVHLGQGDGDPREARDRLGGEAQIGVTCHGSRHLALEAGEAGADYVAFGAFHPSTTKIATQSADPALLRWWHVFSELPSVAIGGITAQNAPPLIEAGADFIAVSGFVWQHPGGPAAAIAELATVATSHRSFNPRGADLAAISAFGELSAGTE